MWGGLEIHPQQLSFFIQLRAIYYSSTIILGISPEITCNRHIMILYGTASGTSRISGAALIFPVRIASARGPEIGTDARAGNADVIAGDLHEQIVQPDGHRRQVDDGGRTFDRAVAAHRLHHHHPSDEPGGEIAFEQCRHGAGRRGNQRARISARHPRRNHQIDGRRAEHAASVR